MTAAPPRTLVVGGAGFIGAHLLRNRLRAGDEVHVLARPATRLTRLADCRDRITVHTAMLDDRARLDAVVADARPCTVFHLAAGDRRAALPDLADATLSASEDLGGLLNLIAACAGAARPPRAFVRASSLAEYGSAPPPYREDQREMPLTAYAAAAVAGTGYARMLAPRLPFALVSARLALCYGPGQSERFLVPQLIAHALAGRPFKVLRPFDRRDLMHVDDAVAGLCALAASPVVPVVNLSTGTAPAMVEVAARIFAHAGADFRLLELGPRNPPGGTAELWAANDLARQSLGWEPRIAWDAGVAATVDWYRDQRGCAELAA